MEHHANEHLTNNNEVSDHEKRRMAAVKSADILDTAPESDYDDLVRLASLIFNVPISTVTIVDSHRQWFKAAVGLSIKETDRAISFCTHVVDKNQSLVVEDTTLDPRFANNPLVANEPLLGFYAGIPLYTSDNNAIGTFCIMDKTPRKLSATELETLEILANQAMKLLELRIERKKLRESEQRWNFALAGSGDGVWDWDVKTDETVFSKQWKKMLGYSEDYSVKNFDAWRQLVHPDDIALILKDVALCLSGKTDHFRGEFRLLCKDNSWKWILSRGMVVARDSDGSVQRMVGTQTDISQRKLSEEVIWKHANFDSLTGLPNRRMFFDRLEKEIKRSARGQQSFALMFIDLDGFKLVNDHYGHRIGDQLLIEVSRRISDCIRESDTVARLGGDEFTVLVNNIAGRVDAGNIAEKILTVLNQVFNLENNKVFLSASIGVSIYPEHSLDADSLVNKADTAMYQAKEKGKNDWKLFTLNT